MLPKQIEQNKAKQQQKFYLIIFYSKIQIIMHYINKMSRYSIKIARQHTHTYLIIINSIPFFITEKLKS